jgi:hypothetical protein
MSFEDKLNLFLPSLQVKKKKDHIVTVIERTINRVINVQVI